VLVPQADASRRIDPRNDGGAFGRPDQSVGAWRQRVALTLAPLLVIGALALAVRFYQLTGRSLWLDEILTSQPAHLGGPADVIRWSQAAVNQMPLFYMFTWLLHPWGDGELVLRLPAVIAGALTVPAVFLVGRATFGTRAGLVGALLTAVMPFAVWYSQEARSYTLLMLLTTMQMWFALRAIKRGGALDWLGLTVFTILNLYTHYLAILATAAVAGYVACALLAGALRRASPRLKAATAILLVVIVTAAAIVPWRVVVGSAYGFAHLHRGVAIGLAASSLIAIGFVAVLVWRRWRPAGYALGAALVVAAAYTPWLPALRVFLSRPDQSLGQIHLAHSPSLADLANTLGGLGLSGLLLAMLCVGVGAAGVWTFQGRATESGLMLAWIGVPLVLLTAYARSAIVVIDIRYLAFLFPAAMILIGGGVLAVASLAEQATQRLQRRPLLPWTVSAFVSAFLTALLLAQALAGLVPSYQQTKDDYRATAQHIAASSPPESVVLTVGTYSDWTVICLDYYFRQLHSDVTVVDGLQVDSNVTQKLTRSSGKVWAVVIFPSPAQGELMSRPGTVRSDFVDITGNIHVLRPVEAGLSPINQAVTLLRWELPLEPPLAKSLTRLQT
jgi:Dolichyl-phosphate-mannose-protein mannosyltransferase